MKRTKTPVLYLGDTSLDSAASDESADRFLQEDAGYQLIILSDFPADNLKLSQMEQIVAWVRRGAGLLMIGGWDSFQGSGGSPDSLGSTLRLTSLHRRL